MFNRLLLISTSTVHGSGYLDYCADSVAEFVGRVGTILFIPYARPSGISHDKYTELARDRFAKLHIELRGISEFSDPRDAMAGAESLFVGGGSYKLQAASPAIDKVDPALAADDDHDGIARPVGPKSDMGAYEWFVAGVTFEPDRSAAGAPGATVTHQHTLTNNGNLVDTFTLTAVSSQGWTVEVMPAEVTLGIGASTTVEVKVTIPVGASVTDVTVVTATSQADSTVSDSITDRTSSGLIFLPMVFH